jgi:hypothetical protein
MVHLVWRTKGSRYFSYRWHIQVVLFTLYCLLGQTYTNAMTSCYKISHLFIRTGCLINILILYDTQAGDGCRMRYPRYTMTLWLPAPRQLFFHSNDKPKCPPRRRTKSALLSRFLGFCSLRRLHPTSGWRGQKLVHSFAKIHWRYFLGSVMTFVTRQCYPSLDESSRSSSFSSSFDSSCDKYLAKCLTDNDGDCVE